MKIKPSQLAIPTLLLSMAAGFGYWLLHPEQQPPIKLGILHSLTGAMATSEKNAVDAELLAIEEINERGGLLGRRVEGIIADGASDWPTFSQEAERLIVNEKVDALIGCWTSASRKTVRPVVEKFRHLLIYPMAYEGMEISPNIIYTGAAPNQQIIPALKWSLDNLGKRIFIIGSDYVWPRSVNTIIRDQIPALKGNIVGEEYVTFGSSNVDSMIEKIKAAKPDVIMSTLVSDNTNIAFYRKLREAGLSSKTTPVVSLSVSETELGVMDPEDITGHYAAWSYFQSIPRKENQQFLQRFHNRYGDQRVVSDVMETAYFSVHLWARSVEQADSAEVSQVNATMLGQSVDAPEGVITVDSSTRHTWRSFNIGQIRSDGQLSIVWSADSPIRPIPYPRTRSRMAWDEYLDNLYLGWDRQWANSKKENDSGVNRLITQ